MRALFVVGIVLAVGCGGAPVRGWRPAPDRSADDAVVFVSTECSGTLVAPTAVVTAAHCVEDPGPWTVRVDGRELPVIDCALHPEAYDEPRACGAGFGATSRAHDLALLTLGAPADAPIAPVLLTAPELRRGWWRGRHLRLVGWDRRPRLVGPLARRSGPNRLIALAHGVLVTEPVERDGFRTVIGDSGGAAFLRVGGTERLVGVLRGGRVGRGPASMYAATFHPANARWLVSALPPDWGRDLPVEAFAR